MFGPGDWDLDLLGHGAHGVADVLTVVRDLCRIESGDGIVFDAESLKGEEIRRLVHRGVLVDGMPRDLLDVLGDTALAPILSDGGVIAHAGYPEAGAQ
jgi:hypothetical protein